LDVSAVAPQGGQTRDEGKTSDNLARRGKYGIEVRPVKRVTEPLSIYRGKKLRGGIPPVERRETPVAASEKPFICGHQTSFDLRSEKSTHLRYSVLRKTKKGSRHTPRTEGSHARRRLKGIGKEFCPKTEVEKGLGGDYRQFTLPGMGVF